MTNNQGERLKNHAVRRRCILPRKQEQEVVQKTDNGHLGSHRYGS